MNDSPNSSNTLKLPIKRILFLTVQLIKQRIHTFLRLGLPIIIIAILGIFMNANNEDIFVILFK